MRKSARSAPVSNFRQLPSCEPLESRQLFSSIAIKVFPVGDGTNFVHNLTSAPNGKIYFSSGLANQVGYITTTGAVGVYNTTAISPHGPSGLTVGPDGNIWMDELFANAIGSINITTGAVTPLKVSSGLNSPILLTVGPDKNFWIESFDSEIERVTPSGEAADFNYSGSGSGPIVSWRGDLYFDKGTAIGEINTSGIFGASFSTPSGGNIKDMIVGPDGNLWFTETSKSSSGADDYFGYLTPTGTMKEFPISRTLNDATGVTTTSDVEGIAAGSDGNIYFRNGDYLIGATTSGTVFLNESLGSGSSTGDGTGDLITGPDGNLWFTESFNDDIGVAYVTDATTTFGGTVTGSGGKAIADVKVFIDVNHTGVYASGDPTAYTNASGAYTFNVKAGTYTVGVVSPTGYAPAKEITVTAALGKTPTANFALTLATGQIEFGVVATDPTASEGEFAAPASTGTILLEREAGATTAVTVNLSIGGTAAYGTDYKIAVYGGTMVYTASTHTLSITLAAGAKGASIVITPQAVTASEPAKTVVLSLLSASAYTTDPANLQGLVTISAH